VSDRPPGTRPAPERTALIERLRAVGCVYAEDEATVLAQATPDPQRLEQLIRRREAGQPLEQVVGWVDFGGLRLAVGPGVFVPRQRSLLLARICTRLARAQEAPVLLEACAGAAPIASTVARAVPGLETHASDIDLNAVRYARRNLTLDARVHHGHLLDATPAALRRRVTLLVAVPPYVPLAAAALLPREAREHEPARALFGGHDGLDHVRELINTARPWLAPHARILVELHSGQYQAAAAHAQYTGCSTRRHDSSDGQTSVLDLRLT
jgi:release factor glutamine methyltransferase